ncbi:hypothetical protein EV356DRAFT_573755 [Viridothelium virens]|uniref:Zn(2)-C6 fungal-type domain-containing protein n=1 Tax=Viridothelium virens TaxID=1048519 RepID=A0A6A6HJ68_VIRVR|nr:hypothetical protein EV356DRAFT_573755 [Viridothelium virens]
MRLVKKRIHFLYPIRRAAIWDIITEGRRVEKLQTEMSYRGRPSKGCQMCRSRKVKCDETKPVCNRCRDTAHECIYRDSFELFFRDQTASTALRAQKQRRRSPEPGSSSRIEASRSPSDPPQAVKSSFFPAGTGTVPDSSSGRIQASFSPSMPSRQFQESFEVNQHVELGPELWEAVINRFFFDFVVPPDLEDPQWSGFLSHLPALFNQTQPNSALANAVTAAAFANYAGRIGNTECETYGLKYYVSALKLMGQAVRDPSEVGSISTLLTSFVLGLYEVITPTHVSAGEGSWATHRDGGSLLLSLRGPQQFKELVDIRLFKLTYEQMITNCLAEGKRPPVAIDSWASHMDVASQDTFGYQILQLMHRTADIAADWTECKSRISSPTQSLADHLSLAELLLRNALSLDAEFEDWEHRLGNLGPEWSFEPSGIGFLNPWEKELVEFAGCPFLMHQYHSLFIAKRWNLHRASRIRLNGIILKLMQRLAMLSSPASENSNPGSKENQARTQALIRSLADDICSSVIALLSSPLPEKPSHGSLHEICGVRGYYLLWPLITAEKYLRLIVSPDNVERARWIQNVLGFIRIHLGIGMAQTDLYETAEI